MKFQSVSVIGLGYIGLPTAAVLASNNVKVQGVDISQEAVDTINNGEIHIVEPGLAEVVKNAVAAGFLEASLNPSTADAFLIAVPTPFDNNHAPDLSYVKSATNAIASVLKSGNLVVLESTSPVGATEKVAAWIKEARPDLRVAGIDEDPNIFVAHCPERVLPGKVLEELVTNDRIIGGLTEKCSELATSLYQLFVKGTCISTNARTAEMAKLTENSFRDVNIAFANELSMICDQLNINVWELISLANKHPRVNILNPGPGVGGHCIAVDPWFIVDSCPEYAKLIKVARLVNDGKPAYVVNQIVNAKALKENMVVACLGLSFKADIDDLRESPAVNVVKKLVELGISPLVVEPNIKKLPSSFDDSITLVNLQEAIAKADIIVVLVDHKEFKEVTLGDLNGKQFIDTRGVFN